MWDVTPGRGLSPLPPQASAEMWRTVRSALGSWNKTAQFCLMVLVMAISATVMMVVALARLSKW